MKDFLKKNEWLEPSWCVPEMKFLNEQIRKECAKPEDKTNKPKNRKKTQNTPKRQIIQTTKSTVDRDVEIVQSTIDYGDGK